MPRHFALRTINLSWMSKSYKWRYKNIMSTYLLTYQQTKHTSHKLWKAFRRVRIFWQWTGSSWPTGAREKEASPPILSRRSTRSSSATDRRRTSAVTDRSARRRSAVGAPAAPRAGRPSVPPSSRLTTLPEPSSPTG